MEETQFCALTARSPKRICGLVCKSTYYDRVNRCVSDEQ